MDRQVNAGAPLPNPLSAAQLRTIGIRDDEYRVINPADLWWRVHRTDGRFVLAWNICRSFGPRLRCDLHPPPPREHADRGVCYAASTPDVALAEAF